MSVHPIPLASAEDFYSHFQTNLRNFAFFQRNISGIMERAGTPDKMAVGYFDASGFLLELFGRDDYLEHLAEEGILPGTVWNLESTGRNAVTEGLAEIRSVCSIGAEHTHPVLKNMAIYFAPVNLVTIQVSNYYDLPSRLGGVTVFTEKELACPYFHFNAASLAHGLEMTLHFNQTAAHGYEGRGTGVLVVDNRICEPQKTIFYANHTLFQALDIPPQKLNFTPLEDFLPQESNQDFYELLMCPYVTKEKIMTLTPKGGKSTQCIIDTSVYYQPSLMAEGIVAYVSTPQMESRKISRKVTNNAVLSFENIIGQCGPIRSAKKRATLLANTDSNIMILGESGVGKDVFAQAIHNTSRRRDKPFVAVNCAALPKDLIASELFGYDAGAFTGAKKNGNMGKFELANGGTIFLDEVGDLPLDLQATLLRIVEQKKLMRLGGTRMIDIDVKIICATNADLAQMVEQHLFRSDLYFRLGTMKLCLPPLRERGGDILLLASHFLSSISQRIGREDIQVFSPEASQCLLSYPWPGNVRELQNVMECIVQLYPQHTILPEHILDNISIQMAATHKIDRGDAHTAVLFTPVAPVVQPEPLSTSVPVRGGLTREQIEAALESCGGNRSAAARRLGIARKTLYRNMERLGMGTTE